MVWIIPFLTAIFWRARGAQHSWGTQLNRVICWCIPWSVLCMIYIPLDWHYAIFLIPQIWACISDGYSLYWKMDKWQDWLFMSLGGVLNILPVLLLFILDYPFAWPLLIAGLMKSGCYWIGWQCPNIYRKGKIIINAGTEWAEFFFGACLGIGLCLSF